MEGHDVALRDFKKDARDEKRYEELLLQAKQTNNSCDKNMHDIMKLQEAIDR